MNILKCTLILAFISLMSAGRLSAAAGSTGGQLLEIIPDARTAALSGAFCGLADDVHCISVNPAGLGLIEHTEISISNNRLYQGVSHQYAALAYSLRDMMTSNVYSLGAFGFSFAFLDSGAIPGRDINGQPTASYAERDRLTTIAYGKNIYHHEGFGDICAGVSAKFLTEEVKSYEAQNSCYDTGILWQNPTGRLSAGMSFQNMGGTLRYFGQRVDAPARVTAGVSGFLLHDTLCLTGDAIRPQSSDIFYRLAAEFSVTNAIVLRAGYDSQRSDGPGLSTGAGIVLHDVDVFFFYAHEFDIHYAFITSDDVGDAHRLTLTFKLGAD